MVVLAPTPGAARTVRAVMRADDAFRIGVCVSTPFTVARRIARTHPSQRSQTPVTGADRIRILETALARVPESIRDDLAGDTVASLARSLAPVVDRLRRNDVSPASLYALSIGRDLSPAHRAVAVAYEAYDRELLDGPLAGRSDVFGWATAQVRTGRTPWLRAATVAVFDAIRVDQCTSAFLHALDSEAAQFVRLGNGTGPDDAPADRIGVRWEGVPASSPSNGRSNFAEETYVKVDTLAEAAEWVNEYLAAEGIEAGTVEIAVADACVPTITDRLRAARLRIRSGRAEPDVIQLVPLEAATLTGRAHRIVLLPEEPRGDRGGPEWLTPDDWSRLSALCDATLTPDPDTGASTRLLPGRRGGSDTTISVTHGARVRSGSSFRSRRDDGEHAEQQQRAGSPLRRGLQAWVVDSAVLHASPGDRERLRQPAYLRSLLPGNEEQAVVDRLADLVRSLLDAGYERWLDEADRVHPVPNIILPADEHSEHGDSTEECTFKPICVAISSASGWRMLAVLDDRDMSERELASTDRRLQRAAETWSQAVDGTVVAAVRFGTSEAWVIGGGEAMYRAHR
jgi:hypothetical protein